MAGPDPRIRLDSLDPQRGARSFRFAGLRAVLRADAAAEVPPVLDAVAAAVDAGAHAAGFVAYEAAAAFDPALVTHPPDPRLPLAWFALYDERHEAPPPTVLAGTSELGGWEMGLDAEAYAARIDRIRDLIAAGDTYQVNFTTRLTAPSRGDTAALYARLCLAQRAAYCAYLELGDGLTVVSASPELFFRRETDELELRPMKGTRPRGRWPEEDRALAAELAESAKDRAENLMIVDLLRNDAGRVAEFGSVEVARLFEVERYETVHQLTSTIRARTRPGTSLRDVFTALFPCGSVTGAPKVRTMEIIRELEDGPRGVYCGAIGFASPGEAVFSVGIRTLLIDENAGRAELGVGSGITFDSDAAAEYSECLDKAAFTRREPAEFALLETLLWEPGAGWFLLDRHLERLEASAEYFGFAFSAGAVSEALAGAAAGFPAVAQRVRLRLDRAGAVRVERGPVPDAEEPVRIAIAAEPVDRREVLLYHKTTHREPYQRRATTRPDVDDVLLVNERGELTESTIANLVVKLDGALWTPPLDCGLLPGVFRAELLDSGTIRERVLHPADLAGAEEIWLINSVRRWQRAELAG